MQLEFQAQEELNKEEASCQKPEAENPAALLIKRQITALEQEINRQIRNQNLTKVGGVRNAN